MKRNLKRVLAVLLTLTLTVSFTAIAAAAASSSGTSTITKEEYDSISGTNWSIPKIYFNKETTVDVYYYTQSSSIEMVRNHGVLYNCTGSFLSCNAVNCPTLPTLVTVTNYNKVTVSAEAPERSTFLGVTYWIKYDSWTLPLNAQGVKIVGSGFTDEEGLECECEDVCCGICEICENDLECDECTDEWCGCECCEPAVIVPECICDFCDDCNGCLLENCACELDDCAPCDCADDDDTNSNNNDTSDNTSSSSSANIPQAISVPWPSADFIHPPKHTNL